MQMERREAYHSGTPEGPIPGGNGARRTLERIDLRSPATACAHTEWERFRVDVHPERETVRVAPVGALDLATATQLRERLDEVRASGGRGLVLDLRGLTFIDASAVRLIIGCNSHARESGIEFSIIQGPRAVRRVFEITRLLDELPFQETSAENGAVVSRNG